MEKVNDLINSNVDIVKSNVIFIQTDIPNVNEHLQEQTLESARNTATMMLSGEKEHQATTDSDNLNSTTHRFIVSGSQEAPESISTEKNKVNLLGPKIVRPFHDIKRKCISKNLIVSKLPEAFGVLKTFADPHNTSLTKKQLLKNFVGNDLSDIQFENLQSYCSTEKLCNNIELKMHNPYPQFYCMTTENGKECSNILCEDKEDIEKFHTYRKYKLRVEKDKNNLYAKWLKYRGLRFEIPTEIASGTETETLIPGKDLIYKVRMHRPYKYNPLIKGSTGRKRAVFNADLVLTGRNTLQDLRDKIQCVNDLGLRNDVSENLDAEPVSSCKELFPSGFLYISGVFYNDARAGCLDYSAGLQVWASERGVGELTRVAMNDVRLGDLNLQLGYPEVYVHQGDCEHILTFTEVRLVNTEDNLAQSDYPYQNISSHINTTYCTTCAEFGAKWLVTECTRVPFDPAVFCDTCLRQYLYIDGKKIGNFKAYAFEADM